MASKRTRIVAGAVAGLVLVAGIGGAVARHNREKVAVQVRLVTRRELVSVVSASGEVKPQRFVDIAANVSGRIVQIAVKEGQRVKKGQVLVRIDSTRIAAGARQSDEAVKAAHADLERALADLDNGRIVSDRAERLHGERLLADQEFDQSRADLKMKQANVESLRRRVAQLQAGSDSTRDDLEKTTVASPMDGVITNLPLEEGAVVIGAQSFSPTIIMTVADLSVMECQVMVDETDIRHLALGQSAEVRVDALEGIKIKGEVTEIGSSAVVRGTGQAAGQTTSASTANQAKDFKVKVTLRDPPASLKPGLNATADITVAKKVNVVAAPIQAVVVREVDAQGKVVDLDAAAKAAASDGNTVLAGGKAKPQERDGVFVIADGKAGFRAVVTGIMGDTDVEIVSGLQEGEEIVSGSYKTLRTLKDQARIKIEDTEKKSWWSPGPH